MAGPIDDGLNAWHSGDYRAAHRLWRPLAEKGNAGAQASIGFLYLNGEGVPQDYAEAVKWFRLAAEQGNAGAQNSLGVMYERGRGVPLDDAEAVNWYRKAAEQGDATAQSNLAVMYTHGRGVQTDDVQAHKWFNLATSRLPLGDARTKGLQNRDLIAAFMTPAQIAGAQKLAREWKPKSSGEE